MGEVSMYTLSWLQISIFICMHWKISQFSEEKHNAVYLAEKTEKIFAELGHKGVAAVVTDTVANVKQMRQNNTGQVN